MLTISKYIIIRLAYKIMTLITNTIKISVSIFYFLIICMWKKELLIRNHCEYLLAMNSYELKCDLVRDIWTDLYIKNGSDNLPTTWYIRKVISKFSI